MNITLVVNANKPDSCRYAESIRQYLEAREVHVKALYGAYTRDDFTDADAIISIGGDGTMLRLAGVLRGQDTPLLGVNAGHLGYLLHGSVRRNDEVISRGTALNEILISRCEGISVLRFTVLCDGEELSHYTADGILFATPTGSTAYNLSAGGPIAAPETSVIIMTPICAHSTNSRPVILPDTSHIEVRIESENEIVAFDGERIVRLQPGDVVKVRRANEMTTFVKLRASSFLETLREKMDDED